MSSGAEWTIDDVVGGWILSPNKVIAGNADAELMCEKEERDASSLVKSSNTELVVRGFRGIGRGRGFDLGPKFSASRGSSGEVSDSSDSLFAEGGVNRDSVDMSGDPRTRWGVRAGMVLVNVAVWMTDAAKTPLVSIKCSM